MNEACIHNLRHLSSVFNELSNSITRCFFILSHDVVEMQILKAKTTCFFLLLLYCRILNAILNQRCREENKRIIKLVFIFHYTFFIYMCNAVFIVSCQIVSCCEGKKRELMI